MIQQGACSRSECRMQSVKEMNSDQLRIMAEAGYAEQAVYIEQIRRRIYPTPLDKRSTD